MSGKSIILVINGTRYTSKVIVEAAENAGHLTSLVWESTLSIPDKADGQEIPLPPHQFRRSELDWGDCNNERSSEKAIEAVNMVLMAHQDKIIAAIKKSGNVKVEIIPFGVCKRCGPDPCRRTGEIHVEVFLYTYISSNFFVGYFLNTLSQLGLKALTRDKVIILGNANLKVLFNKEEDIATYTIKAVDDSRTLNKILYIRPPQNLYSFNDIVSLCEKKISKTLVWVYIPNEQILKNIQGVIFGQCGNIDIPSVFILGNQTNFEIKDSLGVEASELYSDVVKYTTVDEYLDQFV